MTFWREVLHQQRNQTEYFHRKVHSSRCLCSEAPNLRSTGYADTSSATLIAMHIQDAPPANLDQFHPQKSFKPTPYSRRRASSIQGELPCRLQSSVIQHEGCTVTYHQFWLRGHCYRREESGDAEGKRKCGKPRIISGKLLFVTKFSQFFLFRRQNNPVHNLWNTHDFLVGVVRHCSERPSPKEIESVGFSSRGAATSFISRAIQR